jgi:membrane protease subunit HflK
MEEWWSVFMSFKNPWDDGDDDNPWKKGSRSKKGSGNDGFSFDIIDEIKKRTRNFGSRGGDGGKNYSTMVIVAIVAVIAYIGSGLYQVQHDERGVVLRFGRWVRTVGPGLQYVLPYPFETVILQKVTNVKQIDIGSFLKNQQEENLVLTGDSNLANISFSVLWKIKIDGVEDYLFNARSPEITVKAVAESVMRDIVGQTQFTYIQTDGRADIQKKARDSLQALMDEYKMGIEIIRVELQRVEPPISVVDSFRDVERAQAEQQSEKNKAEAYDRDTRARTRGLVAEKVNAGEAAKQSIMERATGAVARFSSALSQYRLAPDIVAKRLYIDTMRDIYKRVDKIIVDEDVKSASYLPLTEISRRMVQKKKQGQEQDQAQPRNEAQEERVNL